MKLYKYGGSQNAFDLGYTDAFVIKFDKNGIHQWTQREEYLGSNV